MIIFGWTPSPATNSYQNLRVSVTDYVILSHHLSLLSPLPLIYYKNLLLSSSIPSFRDKSLLLNNIQSNQKPRYNKVQNINLSRVGLSVALFLTALHSRHVSHLVCLWSGAGLFCLRMFRNTDSLSAFLCLSLPPIQWLYDEPCLFPLLHVAQI